MLETYYTFLQKYKNYQNTLIKDLTNVFKEIDQDITTLEQQGPGGPVTSVAGGGNVNFSVPADHNPEFMILASAIVRPANSYSYGAPISWIILETGDGHGSSFITSAEGNPNGRLTVKYPTVRKVFNVSITPDETFAANGAIVGPTVGFDSFDAAVYRIRPLPAIQIVGHASQNWVKVGPYNAGWVITPYSTGSSLNYIGEGYGLDYTGMTIQYVGNNNYRVRQVFSGLGEYNIRFVLVNNATNADVTTVTADDVVILSIPSVAVAWQIPMAQYSTSDNSNNFMGTFTNFWVLGLFEAWMIASAKSTTEVTVKWQTNYPGATTYKLYRDTQSSFATQQLIHTGTEGIFEDTGLTAGTLYYYKLVAVVSGVDTDVTTFRCKTKA
jgi:hypothetical protein